MRTQRRAARLISGGLNSKVNYLGYGSDLARWTCALRAVSRDRGSEAPTPAHAVSPGDTLVMG